MTSKGPSNPNQSGIPWCYSFPGVAAAKSRAAGALGGWEWMILKVLFQPKPFPDSSTHPFIEEGDEAIAFGLPCGHVLHHPSISTKEKQEAAQHLSKDTLDHLRSHLTASSSSSTFTLKQLLSGPSQLYQSSLAKGFAREVAAE